MCFIYTTETYQTASLLNRVLICFWVYIIFSSKGQNIILGATELFLCTCTPETFKGFDIKKKCERFIVVIIIIIIINVYEHK